MDRERSSLLSQSHARRAKKSNYANQWQKRRRDWSEENFFLDRAPFSFLASPPLALARALVSRAHILPCLKREIRDCLQSSLTRRKQNSKTRAIPSPCSSQLHSSFARSTDKISSQAGCPSTPPPKKKLYINRYNQNQKQCCNVKSFISFTIIQLQLQFYNYCLLLSIVSIKILKPNISGMDLLLAQNRSCLKAGQIRWDGRL